MRGGGGGWWIVSSRTRETFGTNCFQGGGFATRASSRKNESRSIDNHKIRVELPFPPSKLWESVHGELILRSRRNFEKFLAPTGRHPKFMRQSFARQQQSVLLFSVMNYYGLRGNLYGILYCLVSERAANQNALYRSLFLSYPFRIVSESRR